MSSSRHPHLPQPPQTSVSRSVDVAPLILGHPAIRLLKALIGNPPRTANLDPLTFPAGTVGNIRKSQEIQMQTNLMASVRRVFILYFDLLMNPLDRRKDRTLVTPGTTWSQLTCIALPSRYHELFRMWKLSGTP